MFVNPPDLSKPIGYNHGVLMGKTLFVAGQVGWDRDERMAEGLPAQFGRALANVVSVVRAAGGSAENVARLTIYVTDKQVYLSSRREIGEVYRGVMGRHFPAMALVEVAGLIEPGAMVEIEATAVIP